MGEGVSVTERAGYSGVPLHRKLGVGEDDQVAVVGAPDGFTDRLVAEVGDEATITTDLDDSPYYDVIIAFVTEAAELAEWLPRLRARMAPGCGLWIAWPKKASRVRTDMSDQVIRDVGLPTGLVDNKVCAIDQVWSALRLVVRR